MKGLIHSHTARPSVAKLGTEHISYSQSVHFPFPHVCFLCSLQARAQVVWWVFLAQSLQMAAFHTSVSGPLLVPNLKKKDVFCKIISFCGRFRHRCLRMHCMWTISRWQLTLCSCVLLSSSVFRESHSWKEPFGASELSPCFAD